MGNERARVWWWMAICLFVCGCPKQDVPAPSIPSILSQTESSNPEAEKQFVAARERFEQKDMAVADLLFKEFMEQFKGDPLVRQAVLFRGRIALEQGRYKDAQQMFELIMARGETTAGYDHARMYLGVAAYRSGDPEETLRLLEPYAGRFTEPADNLLVLDTLRRACADMKDPVGHARWTGEYLSAGPGEADRARAISDLNERVNTMDDVDTLFMMAAVMKEKDSVWALMMCRAARVQYTRGELSDLADTVEEIRRAGAAFLSGIEDIVLEVDRRNDVDMGTVGCLLPLSGPMRVVGQATLQGVMMGAQRFRFGRERAPLAVVIRDTGGNPETAAAAVDAMVKDDRVSAIIGPMDARVARAAAARAEALGVPIILLSPDRSVVAKRRWAFRNFSSNETEVEALSHALPDGQKRIAILYPDNSYGRQMSELMAQQAQKSGGQVVASISFGASQSDFSASARQLAQVEFDALFLPVTSAQSALIAPALAAVGIWPSTPVAPATGREVTYLISSVGFSTELVGRAGRYLQGARFIVGFDGQRTEGAARFERTFRDQHNGAPSAYAAWGYDAVVMVSLAVNSGVKGRRELVSWLRGLSTSAELVMPFAGFNEEGNAVALPPVGQLVGDVLK